MMHEASWRKFCLGSVSRNTLLNRLLPLSFASFFGTLMIGIFTFPGPFHWHREALSHVISPSYNPSGFRIPSMGFAAMALLLLPLGGYLERRLTSIAPRLARCAGLAFPLALLLLAGVAMPLGKDLWHLHMTLAYASALLLSLGVLSCCVCAIKERLLRSKGKGALELELSVSWILLASLPLAVGSISGIIRLGSKAGYLWAMRATDLLRSTVLWQLAFWEWVGMLAFFGFAFISVLWLPAHAHRPVLAFEHESDALEAAPRGLGSRLSEGQHGLRCS